MKSFKSFATTLVLLTLISTKQCFNDTIVNKCCPMGFSVYYANFTCVATQDDDLQLNGTTVNSDTRVDFDNETMDISCYDQQLLYNTWDEISLDGEMFFNHNRSDLCVDNLYFDGIVTSAVYVFECPCTKQTCVHVCCEDAKIFTIDENKKADCLEDEDGQWTTWSSDNVSQTRHHEVYQSASCDEFEVFHLNDLKEPRSNLTILSDGSLFYTVEGVEKTVPAEKFCIGPILNHGAGSVQVNAIICRPQPDRAKEQLHASVYGPMLIVGAMFMLATLLVHALLPELRRAVRGLSLMAHCACIIVAFIILAIIKYEGSKLEDVPCIVLAYIGQYSFLAAFFWMNVMCIDISLKFRSLNDMLPRESCVTRKMIYYATYAMGVPILIFLATLLADKVDAFPSRLKPGIGDDHCWFKDHSTAILIYLYMPMGLTLLVNCALFVHTWRTLMGLKRESSILHRSTATVTRNYQTSDRKRFILFTKLFALMGIPWVMEIVSWAVGGEDYYWYFTDALNILRSIFIFVMFCCKTKVLTMLKKEYPRANSTLSKWLAMSGSSSNQQTSLEMNSEEQTRGKDNTAFQHSN